MNADGLSGGGGILCLTIGKRIDTNTLMDSPDSPDSPDVQVVPELQESEWSWLKPHSQRDALIIVRKDMDLLHVAREIADDNSKLVQTWISTGVLNKPTVEQLVEWDRIPARKFLAVVVQPYVLIQEIVLH